MLAVYCCNSHARQGRCCPGEPSFRGNGLAQDRRILRNAERLLLLPPGLHGVPPILQDRFRGAQKDGVGCKAGPRVAMLLRHGGEQRLVGGNGRCERRREALTRSFQLAEFGEKDEIAGWYLLDGPRTRI